MYDAFSQDYDFFVNWQNRLDYEMPFIEQQLNKTKTIQAEQHLVLDSACGTGWHVIALAQRGYQTTGADISLPMVERARANAERSSTQAAFLQAGFGGIAAALQAGQPGVELPLFDSLLCLGNSLPHILSLGDLKIALLDFAACLKPDGLLMIQNRNFDSVLKNRERWMDPQSHQEGSEDRIFLRFYDFRPDGLIDFNIITLHQTNTAPWQQQVHSTRLYPLRQQELTAILDETGFDRIESFGDMKGSPFNTHHSGNLIVVCRRC